MTINITTPEDYKEERSRVVKDLLHIYKHPRMFINEKGYLQKLVDLLYNLDYYKNNESIFIR